MLERTRTRNEYGNAAFAFALLSIVGSVLSIINAIPLLITYQLLADAREYGLSERNNKIISYLFELALFLTLATTLLYITFQH